MRSFAIIGAGLAGAMCARTLVEAGCAVTVFDKARGVGGRLANRRVGERRFEHGAPELTLRAPALAPQMQGWLARGVVARTETGWLGVPAQNAVVKDLLRDIPCALGVRVTGLSSAGSRVELRAESGARASFDGVVVTAPAPQASALLEPVAPTLSRRLAAVRYAPCWAILAVPTADPGDPVALPDGRLVREHLWPGRPAAPAWTIHASAAWSAAHLDATPEEVVAHWQAALGVALDHVEAHRWRYARVENPLGDEAASEGPFHAAGDAFLGPDADGALLSGAAAARSVLASGGA